MTTREFLLAELNREVERSRRALTQAPKGKYDWKPHEKSMIFGYLADMVATIPTWITMEIDRDELDIAPAEGKGTKQAPRETKQALLTALDESAADARAALEKTTDEHLQTKWKLLAGCAGVAGTQVEQAATAVVLGGPMSVKVAGAVSPLKKFFWMIASSCLVEPLGPYPVDLINSRIGSGDVMVPARVLADAVPDDVGATSWELNPLGTPSTAGSGAQIWDTAFPPVDTRFIKLP